MLAKKIHLLLFLTIIFFQPLFAQSDILEQYVEEAFRQNLNLKSRQLSREKQLSKIQQANKLWGPTADLNASYILASGGRLINFPIGDLLNPAYSALNQLTNSSQFPDDFENQEIQLTPNNFLDANLTVSMPLLNSSIRYNQKIQRELLRLNDLNIELEKEDVEFKIKTTYFNYLKSLEGIQILENSKKLLEEVLVFNKKLVKFQKATDEIIFDVEYQIEKLNSQKAGLTEQNILAKSLFNLFLNRDLTTEIIADSTILNQINLELFPLADLQKTALENRLEFQQLVVAEDVNDLNRQRIKKEARPTVGIRGGIGVQTEDFQFDTGGPLYTLSIGTGISIYDNGLRKKRIEELVIDRNMLQNDRLRLRQKIEIEVIEAYYGLQSILSRMTSETAAERAAEMSFRRFKTRYENDKALLIELLQSENRLTTSRLSKTLTQFDFLIKKAALEKAIN